MIESMLPWTRYPGLRKAPTQESAESKHSLHSRGLNILFVICHTYQKLDYKEMKVYDPNSIDVITYFSEIIQIMTVEINFREVKIILFK